ncbi:hypothetical protein CkaCkLH20_03016 [Colletotrichum karsti]|uniref:Uncharacterized protein n=1 Tax=Colletotrichum karsti TaxID=1095194 RepID=A0A9P6I957_9PEZI|nr:uncharacterized protein CkaCkLH20_03016 [Colletotrichum karsti]KAF9879473.1 hypothetical protein CkaCkLH20_03016 [Colletotrichum karsti]
MVSFFGLKLGADKKKKAEKAADPKPQPRKRIDQNMLGEGQFFGSELKRPVMINGSRPGTSMSNKSSFIDGFAHPNATSLAGGGSSLYGSRPGTAMSNKNFVANFRHPNAPYLNGGSSSMVDLSAPGGKGGVRPMGSESNLNMGWNNGSMTNLKAIPTPLIITSSEPGTPNSPLRKNNWVHPLDVHYGRDGALSPASSVGAPRSPGVAPSSAPSAVASVSNAPRSPLGQFEFNLNPSDILKHNELTPAPLSPSKAYPSPPPSVNGSLPPLKTDLRLKTAANTVRDAHRPGPTSLPSPTASAERTSEEERFYPRPIIQNVAAKRDTLTHHSPRRQSFSMDVDEDKSSLNFGAQRPTTSGPTSPPPRSALRPSPPVLKNLPLLPTQASTHTPPRSPAVSSPGLPPPRPRQVPYEGPLRSPARTPDDWVNARERMGSDARERPNFEQRERANFDTRGRTMERRERQDSDPRELASPETIIPRADRAPQPQGYIGLPPASRRVAPGEGERNYGITPANRRQPPPPVELQRKASSPQYRQAGWDDRDLQHEDFALISPRMQTPQPPTTNSLAAEPSGDANWPLPSPLASPTFGSGKRPHTPTEKSEGQMSPGYSLPPASGRDQGRDYRRPDFGLRAPTGIADEFRVGFI